MTRVADAEIAEALVCFLWREQWSRKQRLRLADGRQVRVYQTGDPNPDSGPDFLNAAIAFGPGQPIRGDVEVHIRPADWHHHGHETDPRYNNVILHVVMWDDEAQPFVLKHNGQRAPTLALADCLKGGLDRLRRRFERGAEPPRPVYPCERLAEQMPIPALRRVLAKAGDARFLLKARAFEARLKSVSPDQALYEGLMSAAGYAKNNASFHELAERLPWAMLREALRGLPSSDLILSVQAFLFGTAGLLPSQREDASPSDFPPSIITDLEARWRAVSRVHPIRPMEATAWCLFRSRPFNVPTVRLAGMSDLVATGLSEGLADPFLAVLVDQTDASPVRRLRAIRAALDRLLQHDPASPWVIHSRGSGGQHAGRSLLIGTERRRDMIVNVVLPFLFACARHASRTDQQTMVLDVYATHPKLAENAITRQMSALIFRRAPDRARLIDSARLQQGLLHIDDRTCHRKECGQCVMGTAVVGGQNYNDLTNALK